MANLSHQICISVSFFLCSFWISRTKKDCTLWRGIVCGGGVSDTLSIFSFPIDLVQGEKKWLFPSWCSLLFWGSTCVCSKPVLLWYSPLSIGKHIRFLLLSSPLKDNELLPWSNYCIDIFLVSLIWMNGNHDYLKNQYDSFINLWPIVFFLVWINPLFAFAWPLNTTLQSFSFSVMPVMLWLFGKGALRLLTYKEKGSELLCSMYLQVGQMMI